MVNILENSSVDLRYTNIARLLEFDILANKYKANEKLPPERELAQRFNVAHLTLRQSLSLLEKKGLIVRRHGNGNFICDKKSYNEFLASKKQNNTGIMILGMHSATSAANWPARFLRYQGIVEAAFNFNIPIQTVDIFDKCNDSEWLLERFSNSTGLILHETVLNMDFIEKMQYAGVPVVLINSEDKTDFCNNIYIDSFNGAFQATNYLISKGNSRIGLLSSTSKKNNITRRLEGYKAALKKSNIPFDSELVIYDKNGLVEDGQKGAKKLLSIKNPPTAIFTTSDYRAFGVIEELEKQKIKVGREFNVTGFDNIPASAYTNPPLTTVHNPLYETGFEAVRIIYRQKDERHSDFIHTKFDTKLIIRES